MSKFCLVYFVCFPFCLMAQPAFNAGVPHTNTTINWSPSASGSRIAVDYSARKIYIHNGTTWLEYEQGIDRITGSVAPAYTPAAGQSLWAVNAANELYYYNSTWVCISCQQPIVTGATLNGDGTDGNPLVIAQQGATTGQVLKWDGSAWVPSNDLCGTPGGLSGQIQYNNSGVFAGAGVNWDGSRLIVGATSATGNDAVVLKKTFSGTVNGHSIRDEGVVNSGISQDGFGAFDAATTITGSQDYDHAAAFQARLNYTGTNTVDELRGFWSNPANNGTGTVVASKQFIIENPSGTGPITNNYGLFIGHLTKGSGDNYGIYSPFATKSLFGGQIQLLQPSNNETGNSPNQGIMQLSVLGSSNKQLNWGFNSTSNYAWMQSASWGVAYTPILLNPNGGNVGVGTTSTAARINVVGSGATSGTYTAAFHNSTGTNNALVVRDDGKVGIATAAPSTDLTIANANSPTTGGIRLFETSDAANYWTLFTGGAGNYDNNLNIAKNGTLISTVHATDGWQMLSGGYRMKENSPTVSNVLLAPIEHGNSFVRFSRTATGNGDNITEIAGWYGIDMKASAYGLPTVRINSSGRVGIGYVTTYDAQLQVQGAGATSSTYTALFHNSSGTSNSLAIRDDGNIGIGTTSPTRTVDINGELRIRDLATTTATKILVVDNDGVVSSATLGSGLSLSSGVLANNVYFAALETATSGTSYQITGLKSKVLVTGSLIATVNLPDIVTTVPTSNQVNPGFTVIIEISRLDSTTLSVASGSSDILFSSGSSYTGTSSLNLTGNITNVLLCVAMQDGRWTILK